LQVTEVEDNREEAGWERSGEGKGRERSQRLNKG